MTNTSKQAQERTDVNPSPAGRTDRVHNTGNPETPTMNLMNIHPTKKAFKDLAIGDTFDFINMSQPMMNSFYRRCVKISERRYQSIDEPITVYNIGSTSARVYHVDDHQQ